MRKCGFGPSEVNVVVRYGRTVCNFCLLHAKVLKGSAVIRVDVKRSFWCARCKPWFRLDRRRTVQHCRLLFVARLLREQHSHTCGLFCGAGLVLCFWATAEAVSVCVGHGQNGCSGVRRRSRALSPPTGSEDGFDSRHACSTPPERCAIFRTASSGFSLPMATCTQSSSESRRRQVQYGSTRRRTLARRVRVEGLFRPCHL